MVVSDLVQFKLIAHLNASSFAFLNRLEHLDCVLSGGKVKFELSGTIWLPDDVQVLHLHFKETRQFLVLFLVLKVEHCALRRVVQLVESIRLAEWVLLFHGSSNLNHFVVFELSRMRQVLQTVLAVALRPPQDDDVIGTCRHIDLNVLLVWLDRRPYNLKTAQLRSDSFLKPVGRVVLRVDESIPAVNRLNVTHANHISAIVLVVLEVGLARIFRSQCHRGSFQGSRQDLHALIVLDLGQANALWPIDVD